MIIIIIIKIFFSFSFLFSPVLYTFFDTVIERLLCKVST